MPADLGAVLAFYRGELGKREWKETPQGAVVKPDQVRLAFTSPEGPAVLKLGRQSGETTVDLALKIPAAAAQAGMLPAAGKVKLMFGNMGDTEAAITINAKTVKIAPGIGGPTSPNGPTLELAPGKYKYSLQIPGHPVRTNELTAGPTTPGAAWWRPAETEGCRRRRTTATGRAAASARGRSGTAALDISRPISYAPPTQHPRRCRRVNVVESVKCACCCLAW